MVSSERVSLAENTWSFFEDVLEGGLYKMSVGIFSFGKVLGDLSLGHVMSLNIFFGECLSEHIGDVLRDDFGVSFGALVGMSLDLLLDISLATICLWGYC